VSLVRDQHSGNLVLSKKEKGQRLLASAPSHCCPALSYIFFIGDIAGEDLAAGEADAAGAAITAGFITGVPP
jgi:hypothetical protein